MTTQAQTALTLEAPAVTSATAVVETVKPVTKKPRTKAADKAASVAVEKTPAIAKAARKPAATKGSPKAATPVKVIAFCLVNRPASGGNLYAFTQAVLNMTGLMQGKSASKALLNTVVGATAVRYHLNKTTCAIDEQGAVILTPVGVYSFQERIAKGQVDMAMVEAYEALMMTGQENANLAMAKQVNIRAV